MLTYPGMLIAAFIGLMTDRGGGIRRSPYWFITIAAFIVIVGGRYEVGGDWYNYASHFDRIANLQWSEALQIGDPSYYGLSWLVAQIGGNVAHLNLICAGIFLYSVGYICARQPYPWLALITAVPYLIVVVGMGYTRQSVAIGLLWVGIDFLTRRRLLAFVFFTFLGSTFHSTASIALPAVAFGMRGHWSIRAILVLGLTTYAALTQGSSQMDVFWTRYVDAQVHSSGGLIRVLLTACAGAFLTFHQRSLFPEKSERHIYLSMCLLAIASVPLVLVASTAVDRIGLYMLPLQALCGGRAPILGLSPRGRRYLSFIIAFGALLVLCVWLLYAQHSQYWLPYQNVWLH